MSKLIGVFGGHVAVDNEAKGGRGTWKDSGGREGSDIEASDAGGALTWKDINGFYKQYRNNQTTTRLYYCHRPNGTIQRFHSSWVHTTTMEKCHSSLPPETIQNGRDRCKKLSPNHSLFIHTHTSRKARLI